MTDRIRNRTPVTMVSAIRYAREWDVNVVVQPDSLFTESTWTHPGPVSGGIHWPTRTIIWPIDDMDRSFIPAFIHELSHVLVDLNPNKISELDSPILALDHAALRFLGCSRLWSVWMSNFVDWPTLPTRQRHDHLIDSQLRAQSAGLLDDRNEPTFRKAVSRAA